MITTRQPRLWILAVAAAIILLFGLNGAVWADQFAVVANSSNDTVSLVSSSGGGWSLSGDSVAVGGEPRGVTTYGQYAYVVNKEGYVSVLKTVYDGTSYKLDKVGDIPLGGSGTYWATVGSQGDKLYVTNTELGKLIRINDPSGVWTSGGTYDIKTLTDFSAKPQGLVTVSSGSNDAIYIAKQGVDSESMGWGVFTEGSGYSNGPALNGGPMHVAVGTTSWLKEYIFITRLGATTQAPDDISIIDPVNNSIAASFDLNQYDNPETDQFTAAYSVAFQGDYFYVAEKESSKLRRYRLNQNLSIELADPSAGALDIGYSTYHELAFSKDGESLFVTSADTDTLYIVNLMNFNAQAISGFFNPVGVAGIEVDVVPEPSAFAGLAAGMFALIGATRRRTKRLHGERGRRGRRVDIDSPI